VNCYENLFGSKLSYSAINTITFIVRKIAHFSLYFIISFVLYGLFSTYNVSKNKKYKYVILCSFLSACMDEFHQIFVPERDAAIRDVVIDVFGSIIGLVVINVVLRLIRCRNKDKIV
jgi:VanZ family protein